MNVWNERRTGRQIVGHHRDIALVEKGVTMLQGLKDQYVSHGSVDFMDILTCCASE